MFTQNATELAEIRLGVSAIDAGWYTAVVQYGGMLIFVFEIMRDIDWP